MTDIHGPSCWHALHFFASAYVPSKKEGIRHLLNAYQTAYPCGACAKHLTDIIAEYPLTNDILASREGVVRYFNFLHNQVNVRLGKPRISFETCEYIFKPPYIGFKSAKLYKTLGISLLSVGLTMVVCGILMRKTSQQQTRIQF